jgi:hypothetical protein
MGRRIIGKTTCGCYYVPALGSSPRFSWFRQPPNGAAVNAAGADFFEFTGEGIGHVVCVSKPDEAKVQPEEGARLITKWMREWQEGYFRFIEAGIKAANSPAELTVRQSVLGRVVTQGSQGTAGNERF